MTRRRYEILIADPECGLLQSEAGADVRGERQADAPCRSVDALELVGAQADLDASGPSLPWLALRSAAPPFHGRHPTPE